MTRFGSREEYEKWKAAGTGHPERAGSMRGPQRKPGLILAIGAGFILLACFMMLIGLWGAVASLQVQSMGFPFGEIEQEPDEIPFLFEVMLFCFTHMMTIALAVMVISIFVLSAGIFFLRLKAWAKTALEIFSWISLVFIVIAGFLVIGTWLRGPTPVFFGIFGVAVWLFFTLVYAAVPVTALVLMRSGTIKDTFNED